MTIGVHDGRLDIDAVTRHYKALAKLVPLKAITSESDYRQLLLHSTRRSTLAAPTNVMSRLAERFGVSAAVFI
jgi:hypothetical protein